MLKQALLGVRRWLRLPAILLIPRSGPAADPEMGVVPRRAPVPAEARWTNCLMRLADHVESQITGLKPGHAAMWAHWPPKAKPHPGAP